MDLGKDLAISAEEYGDWTPAPVALERFLADIGRGHGIDALVGNLVTGELRSVAGGGRLGPSDGPAIVRRFELHRDLWSDDQWTLDGPLWVTGQATFSQGSMPLVSGPRRRNQGKSFVENTFTGIRFETSALNALWPPDSKAVLLRSSTETEKGGRPSKGWWDDLWIEMARQIYFGDLKPDKLATIERAMHDWLATIGESAGETTIRDRARKLLNALNKEVGN